MKEGIRDFRMVSKRVAKDIINMKEYNRYSKGIVDEIIPINLYQQFVKIFLNKE